MIKILIVNDLQFGYSPMYLYFAKYLATKYYITYLCFYRGLSKLDMPNIKIISINKNSKIKSNIKYFFSIINLSRKNDIIILKSYPFSWLIRILYPRKKIIFDIRSASVDNIIFKRLLKDSIIRFNTFFFKNIIVISHCLSKRLKIPSKKVFIVPSGADILSKKNKTFNSLNLLYVGTLDNRNLEKMIEGFYIFYKEFKNVIEMKFTIVGSGNSQKRLEDLVKEKELNNVIFFKGFIHHKDLSSIFDNHNIGISFIPITDFYNCQPVTKTFEYLLSGMPVLATATYENSKIINDTNGILIKDEIKDVYNGLKKIMKKLGFYNSNEIRKTALKYNWEIIMNRLEIYLENIK